MTERERVAAQLREAVRLLQARDAELTPLERIKLKSLALNLQRLRAASPADDATSNAGSTGTETCDCNFCKQR